MPHKTFSCCDRNTCQCGQKEHFQRGKQNLTKNQLELTKYQKDKLRNQLTRELVASRNLTHEFISCYITTDKCIKEYVEHIQQQTGLSIDEIVEEK